MSSATKGMSRAIAGHNHQAVLLAYRNFLRSTLIAFRDDRTSLDAARTFGREEFNKNRTLKEGCVEAQQAVEHVKAVSQILRENVVQGVQAEAELNIHEHTERGDNESIKKLKGRNNHTTREFKGTNKSFSSMKD